MGVEEDLFNMLKHVNLGGAGPQGFMDNIINQYQLNVFRMLRSQIDAYIKNLSSRTQGGGMDPFMVLGVGMDASEEEVTKAYKEKARAVHPDKGGSNEEMVKVNAAYEVIRRLKGWK